MAEIGVIIIIAVFVILLLVGFGFLIAWLIAKSKGKIELIPERLEYHSGETIKGKLKLILKKPLEAEALNIAIIGVEKINRTDLRGRRTTRRETFTLFKKPLAGKGDYPIGENTYDFDISIPKNLSSGQMENSTLGQVVKAAQILSGNSRMVKWYIKANLEISGMDISGKKQINIF